MIFHISNYVEFWSVLLREDLKLSLALISNAPGSHHFWQTNFILAIFVEGHLLNILAKLYSILTIGFNLHAHWSIPWNQPLLYVEGLLFMDFDNVHVTETMQAQ